MLTDFMTTFDPERRDYMLETFLDIYDGTLAFEDLSCSEDYENATDDASQAFEEWFYDNLPERSPDTPQETSYASQLADDFGAMFIDDLREDWEWEETKRSLMGPL